jgi:RNA polymerase sigma-70 factor (ECF subfamily)
MKRISTSTDTARRRRRFLVLASMADSELVYQTRLDRPEAFQVLADRYEKLVRSIACKFVGDDPMMVEDICQETFLRALMKLGDLRDKTRFRSWICTIARNQALDASRKRALVLSTEVEGEDGENIRWEIADSKSNPAELHAQAEVQELVNDVLADIPDMYRQPMKLRFEEGLDYCEIAEVLDKPLGTVKSLIHRGKSLVRREVTRRAWSLEGAQILAGNA